MAFSVVLDKAKQSTNLSVSWAGLDNIFVQDSGSDGSFVTGFAATSNSSKNGSNLFQTESILLSSNQSVSDATRLMKVNLEVIGRANVAKLGNSQPKAELLVKLHTNNPDTNGRIIGSINLSNKFKTYIRSFTANIGSDDFSQGYEIGLHIQASTSFSAALDFVNISLDFEEATNIAQITDHQVNITQGEFDFETELNARLSGQPITISQGEFVAEGGTGSLLSPQTITIGQGSLYTNAPDTWTNWEASANTILALDVNTDNTAFGSEDVVYGNLIIWEGWGSALPYYDGLSIAVDNIASALEFTGWENWSPTTSGYSIIEFNTAIEATISDNNSGQNPWFTTFLSADANKLVPINIAPQELAFWEDSGLDNWSLWEASAQQVINFSFMTKSLANYTAGDGPWEFWGFNPIDSPYYKDIPFDYPTEATHTDPYISPNVIEERSLDFTGVPTSGDNANPWMSWDDRPRHDILDFQFIVDATVIDPAPHPNIQSWYNYNLEGILLPPGTSNEWMEWDNHPRYKSLIVDSSAGPTLHNDTHISPNTKSWFSFNLAGVPISADQSNAWMGWDNHPRYSTLSIMHFMSAQTLFDSTFTSPNTQSWYDYDLDGIDVSADVSLWMGWDEHPRYKYLSIAAEGSAHSDDEFISTNVVDFKTEINYDGVYVSADNPNPWMKYDNQPQPYIVLVADSSSLTMIGTSALTSASSNTINFRYDIDYVDITATNSGANPWELWDGQPQEFPIAFNANVGATNDSAHESLNVESWYDFSYPVPVSASSIWMGWDEHPRYRYLAIGLNLVGASFEDTRTSAVGSDWMDLDSEEELVPNSAASVLNVFFSPIGLAKGEDYQNPHVISQCSLNYTDVTAIGSGNPWMQWDDQPCYVPINIRSSEFGLLKIPGQGIDSVWFDHDGTNDSPSFVISDDEVSTGFDMTVNTDSSIFFVYGADTGEVKSFVVDVSGYDLQLTNEIVLTSAGEQPYIIKTIEEQRTVTGYLHDTGSGYIPRYNYITYNKAANNFSKSIDLTTGSSVLPGPARLLGTRLGDGSIFEYRESITSAKFKHILISNVSNTVITDASAEAFQNNTLPNITSIAQNGVVFNYENDINTARIAFVSAPSIDERFIGVTNIYPDSFADASANTYIQVYKGRSDTSTLLFKKYEFNPGGTPVVISRGTISTSADFQLPEDMETIEIEEDVYITVAQASGGNVYGQFFSFDSESLLVAKSSDWHLIGTSAASDNILQVGKFPQSDRIAITYKHQNNKLVIKVLQA